MSRSKSQKSPIEVDMVSDFVCPWCWLGLKQFLAAAKGKAKPEFSFRPYMLDPTVPDEGINYKDYMRAKFGEDSSDRFKSSREHLERAGSDYGIQFDFDAIERRPNTLNAHRLQKWAEGQDEGLKCAEALFKAYHELGQDIGDIDILCDIAVQIGLDGELVRELLSQDDDKLPIQQEIMFFRGLGVSGVPTFIYNGAFALQGAQDPEAHRKAFEKAQQEPPLNS